MVINGEYFIILILIIYLLIISIANVSFSWKDFLPKLLNKVVEEGFIQHNGTKKKGSEYKSEVIIAICIFDWPNEIITDIASMFM